MITTEKTTTTPRVDWFDVGRDHWEGNEARILDIVERVEWRAPPCDMPMCSGWAINAAIENFDLRRVSAVCDSNELAPYGLVGIECHFSNADVKLFLVDRGSTLSTLCALVTEKGGAA